jgi:hypothetical protein
MTLDCESGTSHFVPAEEGFQEGDFNLTRITYLAGLGCEGAAKQE